MGSKEPLAGRREWPVEFALYAVGVAKNKIGAPFRPVSGDVEEGQAGGESEIHVVAFRSIHFKTQLQGGRSVELFVHRHQQSVLPVLLRDLVSGGIVATDSGQPREQVFQLVRVDRFSSLGLQKALDVFLGQRACALHLHKLRNRDVALPVRLSPVHVLRPGSIIQRISIQQARFLGGGCRVPRSMISFDFV